MYNIPMSLNLSEWRTVLSLFWSSFGHRPEAHLAIAQISLCHEVASSSNCNRIVCSNFMLMYFIFIWWYTRTRTWSFQATFKRPVRYKHRWCNIWGSMTLNSWIKTQLKPTDHDLTQICWVLWHAKTQFLAFSVHDLISVVLFSILFLVLFLFTFAVYKKATALRPLNGM